MLSEKILKAAEEVMRQCQNGTHPISDLAVQLCRLFRLTALMSSDPKLDITQLRSELESFIPELAILDAVAGHVLQIYETKPPDEVEKSLDALVEEVRESDNELAEQLSSLLNSGDHALVLGEREGSFVETALKDAADAIREEDPKGSLKVTIVTVLPDHENVAENMLERLKKVRGISCKKVNDAHVVSALQKCNKVILPALAVDVDDGGLCLCGSSLICAAANRMRIPIVLALPKHRFLPVGMIGVSAMSRLRTHPGKIWAYEESRDDRKCDPITIVSPAYDLVSLDKFQMIVTEFGGFNREYAKSFAPNFDNGEEDVPDE